MKSPSQANLRNILEMDIQWENPERVWEEAEGGYSIVKVATQWDYCLEGYFLSHCIGTKDIDTFGIAHKVYSLRDALGVPHCTILCQNIDKQSMYGASGDIITHLPFLPEAEGPILRVLQVRGRHDKLAMRPYMQMVLDWYKKFGGEWEQEEEHMIRLIENYCSKAQYADFDFLYHFRYMMDDKKHPWLWASHNEELTEAYTPH